MSDSGMDLYVSESHAMEELREAMRSDMTPPMWHDGYDAGTAASRAEILAALRAHGLHRWQPTPREMPAYCLHRGDDGSRCQRWKHEHLDWLFDLLEAKP